MDKRYKDYYKTHIAYSNNNQSEYLFKYYKKNISPVLDNYDKSIKILDIGCGKGDFAKFLKSEGFHYYVGLDLDENQIEINKKYINGYNFFYQNGINFLETNQEKFDVIFISHVLEHLNQHDLAILIKKISDHLCSTGIFINIMPNGGSLFFSNVGRYADNTHENFYTENSFTQILLKNGFDAHFIQHKNSRPNSLLLEIIRKICKFFIKVFILFLGYPYPNVDTFEIITLAKKH